MQEECVSGPGDPYSWGTSCPHDKSLLLLEKGVCKRWLIVAVILMPGKYRDELQATNHQLKRATAPRHYSSTPRGHWGNATALILLVDMWMFSYTRRIQNCSMENRKRVWNTRELGLMVFVISRSGEEKPAWAIFHWNNHIALWTVDRTSKRYVNHRLQHHRTLPHDIGYSCK